MGSLLALLSVVFLALLVVRIGTNALVLTGMSISAARFQAASAFFGVGYTTSEAEMVLNHEVRRKIILYLIVLGNIGITSVLATLVLTFVQNSGSGAPHLFYILGVLLLGIVGLYLLSRTRFVAKPMDALMRYSLERAGVVKALDYELLLNVENGYCVSDFHVEEGHPFAYKSLFESRPSDQGVVILSVTKEDGTFIGTPNKDEILMPGDTIMVYGNEELVEKMVHSGQ